MKFLLTLCEIVYYDINMFEEIKEIKRSKLLTKKELALTVALGLAVPTGTLALLDSLNLIKLKGEPHAPTCQCVCEKGEK